MSHWLRNVRRWVPRYGLTSRETHDEQSQVALAMATQQSRETHDDQSQVALAMATQQEDPAPEASGDSADLVQQPSQPDSAEPSSLGSEDKKIYRVPDYMNPDHPHFKPMELRLGLYTHPTLETAQRGMGSIKVQVVQKIVQGEDGGGTLSVASASWMGSEEWRSFVNKVSQNAESDAEAMYAEEAPSWRTRPAPVPGMTPMARYLLVLDALFVCVYVSYMSNELTITLDSALEFRDLESELDDLEREVRDLGNLAPEYKRTRVLELKLRKVVVQLAPKLANEWKKIFLEGEFLARKFPLQRDLMVMGNQLPMALLLAVMEQLIRRQSLTSRNNNSNAQTHSGEVHPDNSPIESVMLNHVLIRLAVRAHPFAHGVKSITWKEWKRELRQYMEKHYRANRPDALCKCSHILASIYMAICGGHVPNEASLAEEENVQDHRQELAIPSARILKLNGIKFKAVDRPFLLDTIKFKKRTLMLPKLVMDDHTASLFRNLALYEQGRTWGDPTQPWDSIWTRFDWRCYLQLMDSLIDTPEDVRLLVQSGVLVNCLSSEEAVSNEWNSMCQGLLVSNNIPLYRTLQEQIDVHLRAEHNKWYTGFKARNWVDPVHFCGWLFVVLVVLATILQAVMAVLAYAKPPESQSSNSPTMAGRLTPTPVRLRLQPF